MAIEYSLDQRRYRLNMTKKELYEVCQAMGADLTYDNITVILHDQERARSHIPEKVDKLRQVMLQLETQKGITDIYFDER